MKKAPGTTLDMNGRRATVQRVAAATLSHLSKAVKSIRIRKPSTKSAKPKGDTRLHAELKGRSAYEPARRNAAAGPALGVVGEGTRLICRVEKHPGSAGARPPEDLHRVRIVLHVDSSFKAQILVRLRGLP
jgi:hypothetical protein